MSIPAVDPFWMWMVAKIAGLITAFAVINKYAIKPFRKNVLVPASEFYSKVNRISTELKPNGGDSFRDKLDAISTMLPRLQELQRSFFQFEPHPMFESDVNGEVIWVNRACMDMLKRHTEDLTGSGWRSAVAEKDRDRVVHEWLSAVMDHRDFQMRFVVIDVDGKEINIETRAIRILDSKGKFMGHLGQCLRLDRPPPGCRWCLAIEELTDENYKLIKQQVDIKPKA